MVSGKPFSGETLRLPEFVEFARAVESRRAGRGIAVTWLNHYSAINADWDALSRFDLVGIDGTLMQMILRSSNLEVKRTSADLVLPIYLTEFADAETRVAVIGGVAGVAQKAGEKLPNTVVFTANGFNELEELLDSSAKLVASRPDIVIVALGAGLQERVALHVGDLLPEAVIFTAGGWLDQLIAAERYFPPIVHAMRLGWLRRLVDEPKRLVRRYTVDALSAVGSRSHFMTQISRLGWSAQSIALAHPSGGNVEGRSKHD
jgi:exopolysaccharide biosynthesis WecB/TagA/CpsF family protein